MSGWSKAAELLATVQARVHDPSDPNGSAKVAEVEGAPPRDVLMPVVVDTGESFLTYRGGGVGLWGIDDGGRDLQTENIGDNWDGSVGASEGASPVEHKWSATMGGKRDLDGDVRIGGLLSLFY